MQNDSHTNLRLEKIEEKLGEIGEKVGKIENLLISAYEKPGLIEDHRSLKKDVNNIEKLIQLHDADLKEFKEFRWGIKKTVGGIAVLIPVLFEGIKLVLMAVFKLKS